MYGITNNRKVPDRKKSEASYQQQVNRYIGIGTQAWFQIPYVLFCGVETSLVLKLQSTLFNLTYHKGIVIFRET